MPVANDSLPAIEALVREKGDGYSGADLAALARDAAVGTLKMVLGDLENAREADGSDLTIGVREFESALDRLGPSVTPAQRRKYEALRSKFTGGLPVRTDKVLDDGRDEKIV